MTQLKDKKVLITGSAQGLGRLLAQDMAKKGVSDPILLDLNLKGLEETKNSLGEKSSIAKIFLVTFLKRSSLQSRKQFSKSMEVIDILIQNAGVVQGKKILDTDDDLIEKTFLVNTISNFWLTKSFLPKMMEKNEGHIVTISSVAAFTATSKLSDYSASKCASFGYNEALRLELSDYNSDIKTTIICPYYMSTGMFEGSNQSFLSSSIFLNRKMFVKRLLNPLKIKRLSSLLTFARLSF